MKYSAFSFFHLFIIASSDADWAIRVECRLCRSISEGLLLENVAPALFITVESCKKRIEIIRMCGLFSYFGNHTNQHCHSIILK